MKKERIVIALGRNALGKNLPEQHEAVKNTAKGVADLIEEGHQVIISHSNGNQVGMIHTAMSELSRKNSAYTVAPLSVCDAMSQGYIGYDLQNAIRAELVLRGIVKPICTIITQVRVDPYDEAFYHPSKIIGRYMTKEEAELETKKGNSVAEDGEGFRKLVAAPEPLEIVEIDSIRTLVNAGHIVIACGGGGIPVMEQDHLLKGASAVIEKDLSAAKLAEQTGADKFMILTAVDTVYLNYRTPAETSIREMSVEAAKQYMKEGHFEEGTMLPKIKAAIEFSSSAPTRETIITSLEKAKAALDGKTGTVIK